MTVHIWLPAAGGEPLWDKSQNWSGSSAKDTLVRKNGDLVGVIQDTTNFYLSLDVSYV